MNTTTRRLLAAAMIACTATPWAQDDIPAQEIRALMVAAIDAPSGQARGTLTGPLSDAMRTRFKASGPIEVEVTTLRRYAQPGCRRLNVRFSQVGVMLSGASTPRAQTVEFGINYCRDGSPPASLK